MLHLSPEDRYRCTGCGDCCRHWDVPLGPGEAEGFEAAARDLVPVDRLRGAVGRAPAAEGGDRLRLRGRDCPALAAEDRCAIHAARGADAKPAVCRIYPYRFVQTPEGVAAHLYWSCPAVVDAEGPTLAEESVAVEAAFALADTRGYVTTVGPEVALTRARRVPYAAARALVDALLEAFGTAGGFVGQVHALAGVAVAYDEALGEGSAPAAALALARERGPARAAEALAEPVAIDRLSRGLFKALLFLAQGESSQGVWAGLREAVRSLAGRATVRLRDGAVTDAEAVTGVRGALPADGEGLLGRWLRAQLRSMAFFGPGRGDLSVYEGLEFLVLSSAVAVYLARAHAAAAGRATLTREDVRAGVLQLESRLVNRTDLPSRFGLALTHTATLDLLREQAGG